MPAPPAGRGEPGGGSAAFFTVQRAGRRTTVCSAPVRHCPAQKKSGGVGKLPPEEIARSLISGGQSVLRQGGQPKTAAEKQKGAAEQIPPQPIFCVKSNCAPYLQGSSTQPILSSYPDFASRWLPHRLLRKNPNDRLSPCAAASSLTVAVPFGSCTRFPILL